jgi:hypothetical protein
MKIYFNQLEDGDLNALIDVHVPLNEELSIPLSL